MNMQRAFPDRLTIVWYHKHIAENTLNGQSFKWYSLQVFHYSDIIMSMMASQITGIPSVCSTVCSGANQRKYQSSASLVLWGEFTDDRWIPLTKGQLCENFPIWWGHDIFLFFNVQNTDKCTHILERNTVYHYVRSVYSTIIHYFEI